MNEGKLNSFKKIYWDIKLSDKEVDAGWKDLQLRIKFPVSSWFFRQRFILAGLILALIVTTGAVSAASPTSPLYPVKVLADKVIAQVVKKPEIKLEKKIEEIASPTKKPEQLNKADKEDKKVLDEVKNETKVKGVESKEFQKDLIDTEKKSDQTIKKDPEPKKQTDPEESRNLKKQIKEKSEPKSSEDSFESKE